MYTTSKGTSARLKDSSVDMSCLVTSVTDPIIDAASMVFGSLGYEVVITSACDGTHSAGSLHYEGKALDLRCSVAWGFSTADCQAIEAMMAERLGTGYDVVLESTHLHVEYDPN